MELYSETLRAEIAARERAMLRENYITERTSLTAKIDRLAAELVTFDQAAASLKAVDERAVDLPQWIFTTGASDSMIGGIPQQSVRGLIGLAIGQGLGWLHRKREKTETQLKAAQARLAVVEKELPTVL